MVDDSEDVCGRKVDRSCLIYFMSSIVFKAMLSVPDQSNHSSKARSGGQGREPIMKQDQSERTCLSPQETIQFSRPKH